MSSSPWSGYWIFSSFLQGSLYPFIITLLLSLVPGHRGSFFFFFGYFSFSGSKFHVIFVTVPFHCWVLLRCINISVYSFSWEWTCLLCSAIFHKSHASQFFMKGCSCSENMMGSLRQAQSWNTGGFSDGRLGFQGSQRALLHVHAAFLLLCLLQSGPDRRRRPDGLPTSAPSLPAQHFTSWASHTVNPISIPASQTNRLLPAFGYFEEIYCEHSCSNIFMGRAFNSCA